MSILEAFILGVLQGITEFLPISSSGHLVLGEHFLGLNVEELKNFDVLVHMGTLLAILLYFKEDVLGMLKAFCGLFIKRLASTEGAENYRRLIILLIIGTIPAVIVGLLWNEELDQMFRQIDVVAMWMIIVGVIFILGEMVYSESNKGWFKNLFAKIRNWFGTSDNFKKDISNVTWRQSLIIGIAQAIALVPGISRSGSTIVAGIFQGIERRSAARFSFLLGIPAILGAGILTAIQTSGAETGVGAANISNLSLLVGFLSSLIFGLLTIYFMMRFLKNHTLKSFAAYLIIVGTVVQIIG